MDTNKYISPQIKVIPFTPRTHLCDGSPAYTSTEALSIINGGSLDD